MPNETKLRKHLYIPFLDTSKTGGITPDWARIDKSTIFALNPNPQTEDMDYISMEMPVTEIDHYKPELPQEIALYEGNPMYDFMFGLFYDLPVGSEAKVPFLMCFAGKDKKAWKVDDTTVTLGELDTVAGKLSFTLNMGGNIERGVYAIGEDGVPTFTSGTNG